ncbi:MAG: ROK family protein [Atopobiaceae bacterium]|nr:ROK family protein [Atopobiaceae bacterium]
MSENGEAFRAWILNQRVCDATPTMTDDDHVRIEAGTATAEIIFYPYGNDLEIAEYQIVRTSDGESIFYLHVLLDDLNRAQDLFYQMVEALEDESSHTTSHILLCCTSAITTSYFAAKMNEVAQTLSLDYEFTAKSVERALESDESYAAILLAPQASHRRTAMIEAHPEAFVFEIPGKIFGSYDAAGAMRLVMHAFREASQPTNQHESVRVARDLSNDRRILIITLFTMRTYSRLGYRLYDHGVVTTQGSVRKPKLDYRDVEDLLETMDARGVSVKDLDIIGIAVPGVAYHGVVSLPNEFDEDYDLGRHIQESFGIRTSVDNNCNAAAVGCYVGQDKYESVMFYRHEFGHVAGGLGTVIDGTLLKGRHNLAGEPKYYESLFRYNPSYEEMLWSEEGMFQIARNVLLSGISLVAPEAFFLAVDTVDDMDELRVALASDIPENDDRCILGGHRGPLLGLPDELIPPLYVVDDYVERVYLGEMALCLQKLRDPNYRSLGIA